MHLSWFCFVVFLYVKINCYQVVILFDDPKKLDVPKRVLSVVMYNLFDLKHTKCVTCLHTAVATTSYIVRWMFSCNHGYCANYHWNDEWIDTKKKKRRCVCILFRGEAVDCICEIIPQLICLWSGTMIIINMNLNYIFSSSSWFQQNKNQEKKNISHYT